MARYLRIHCFAPSSTLSFGPRSYEGNQYHNCMVLQDREHSRSKPLNLLSSILQLDSQQAHQMSIPNPSSHLFSSLALSILQALDKIILLRELLLQLLNPISELCVFTSKLPDFVGRMEREVALI